VLNLRPEPARREVYRDPEQLELWPVELAAKRKGLWKHSGAPLLLEHLYDGVE